MLHFTKCFSLKLKNLQAQTTVEQKGIKLTDVATTIADKSRIVVDGIQILSKKSCKLEFLSKLPSVDKEMSFLAQHCILTIKSLK